MNFEVLCFDFVGDSLTVVRKEYFDDYVDAADFRDEAIKKYEGGVSITPLNKAAEVELECCECGGQYGYEYCLKCKYRYVKI